MVKSKKENLFNLTKREIEVLRLIVEGENNKEIAKILFVSSHTIKAHVCSIIKKLNAKNRIQAGMFAIKNNLLK